MWLVGGRLVARVPDNCRPGAWRAFVAAIVLLWIAIASPIDALDDYLLAAHMIQHFILMSVAPPLIVLGAPTVPLLRGLPRLVRVGLRPLFRAHWLRSVLRFFVHPVSAWLLMNIAYLGWHVPAAFEWTFRSEAVHQFEHACFFLTSVAFWWVVLAPWPSHRAWPRWTVIPYLLSADVLNTILSATLAFSGRPLYPSYAQAERVSSLTTAAGSGGGGGRDVGAEFAGVPCARNGADISVAGSAFDAQCIGVVPGQVARRLTLPALPRRVPSERG